jgi:hypothetical protein
MSYPKFDDLPEVEGQPKGFAWGVFDKDGKKDVLGTLNFITKEAVIAAAGEVKDGVSISLKYRPSLYSLLGIPKVMLTTHSPAGP